MTPDEFIKQTRRKHIEQLAKMAMVYSPGVVEAVAQEIESK